MNDFSMMHLFFTITSIFMGLLCLLVIIVIYFAYKTFKSIQEVTEQAKKAGLQVANTVEGIAGTVKTESQEVVSGVGRLIQKILPKK